MPPAARVTDPHSCPNGAGPVTPAPGPPHNVMIDGLLAATVTCICTCRVPGETIAKGSMTVFIGGKPAARMGDQTSGGGTVTKGSTVVMIGG